MQRHITALTIAALLAVIFFSGCQGSSEQKASEHAAVFPVLGTVTQQEHAWGRPSAPAGSPEVFTHRDQIYAKQPLSWRKLSRGPDKFFGPELSPDGKFVLFTGLSTGVHVVRVVDGREMLRDEGTSPSWSPDSRTIAYEKTVDDGHEILESDIYMASVDGTLTVNLTATANRIERKPVFSPDGKKISFELNGMTYIANLEWVE
ncbi:MAG: hypothetical protein ABIJ56_10295 [Pseudomonadota bacterium]